MTGDVSISDGASGSLTAPVIVAIHGNGGGGERFARVREHGTRSTWITPTLPGFGHRPVDPSLRSVADYADHVHRLLGSVDGPVVLLGHGIGGSFVLDLASRHRDAIAGLILHAPVAADLDTRLFPRIMSTRPVRELVRRAIAARLLRPVWRRLFFPTGAPRATLDTFFEGYRGCRAFGQMFDIIDASWFESLTPVTDVPVIVLWGSQDRVLRSGQADRVLTKVPSAEVVVREGWDHFPMIEDPDSYAEEIDALAARLVAR
jgi:pimeloyl-ACP methyl ester carboxylesterase